MVNATKNDIKYFNDKKANHADDDDDNDDNDNSS